MTPDHDIAFLPLAWDELQAFLARERSKINRDIDQDVRFMTYAMYCEQRVEGLHLNGELVGFARWDLRNRHLSNLYVMPEARGHGIARRYMQERKFTTLYVIPTNEAAKRLYNSLGFIKQTCAVPSREFMVHMSQLVATT